MACCFSVPFFKCSRRGYVTVLAFTLCTGFVLGSVVSLLLVDYDYSLMRTAAESGVSIVSLLPVIILPFLLTAFAVLLRQRWLLILFGFTKAFLFSFALTCVVSQYASSGWLISMLLLFSDILTFPVLCWVWIRVLIHPAEELLPKLSFVLIPLLCTVYFDAQFISPFLVHLLS